VAILGIGSSLRGDDALGLYAIQELKVLLRKIKLPMPVKLFSCGTTPENYTGEIKKFNPTHIVIVDAATMGKEAGKISILNPEEESFDTSFSTHRLPIKMLINYLAYFLNCRIIPVIIQPKSVEFGTSTLIKRQGGHRRSIDLLLSGEVEKAIKKISYAILDVLGR
jgi:hydrogenase 3 maturation protease